MFGFFKRRRLAREAAAEAARQKLLDRMALTSRHQATIARQFGVPPSKSSSSSGLVSPDPMHSHNPLNPLSPLSGYSQDPEQGRGYVAPPSRPDPEQGRGHCAPSASDDSWSRSSSSGSDYGCSSSSYDSGSSSSSSDSSSY